MAFHLPFELDYWLINVLAGDLNIFLAIAFILIGIGSIKFGFPTIVTIFSFGLFIFMLSVMFGGYLIVGLIFIAIIIGWSLKKIIS